MNKERPVALITGAARRIGKVVAQRLHAENYDLVLHYRHSAEEMLRLRNDLESARSESVHIISADLADDPRQLPLIIDGAIKRFGRLDALINNASSFYPTPIGKITAEQWNELFASNAQAPLFLSQAAAPFLKTTRGNIINIVDIYAERPLLGHTVYCMAKAALSMMTMSLARELSPEIRVNGIAPGAVLWPEASKAYTDQQTMVAATPLKRAGSPEDIANAALYLLRDARFVTGQILRVDGGRMLVI